MPEGGLDDGPVCDSAISGAAEEIQISIQVIFSPLHLKTNIKKPPAGLLTGVPPATRHQHVYPRQQMIDRRDLKIVFSILIGQVTTMSCSHWLLD